VNGKNFKKDTSKISWAGSPWGSVTLNPDTVSDTQMTFRIQDAEYWQLAAGQTENQVEVQVFDDQNSTSSTVTFKIQPGTPRSVRIEKTSDAVDLAFAPGNWHSEDLGPTGGDQDLVMDGPTGQFSFVAGKGVLQRIQVHGISPSGQTPPFKFAVTISDDNQSPQQAVLTFDGDSNELSKQTIDTNWTKSSGSIYIHSQSDSPYNLRLHWLDYQVC
jgi:hypothetical protein